MSTAGSFNSKNPTIKRILKEASELSSLPSTDYTAAPLEFNFFEWHFTLRGPSAPSPYDSGLYHGRIILPPTYPLRPPSFRFLTPSGRFEPNREICLSISGHHEESWQPAWGIRTALVAIRAFMESEAKGQVGGVDASKEVRRRLARESRGWRCVGCGGRTCEEIMTEREREVGEERTGKEEVPQELRLGYKDEMGKDLENKSEQDGVDHKGVVSRTEREEMSSPKMDVREGTVVEARISQGSENSRVVSDVRTAPVSTPTTTVLRQAAPRRPPQRDSSNKLDMAIAALAATLALLIMRKVAYYL